MDIGLEPKHAIEISPLNIIRTIAQTTTTLNDAFSTDNVCLVWLMIETGAIVDDEFFQIACNRGHTDQAPR